jgi:hypothetical protein
LPNNNLKFKEEDEMKRLLVPLCIVLLALGFSFSSEAALYTGADIVFNGIERVKESDIHGGWFEEGTAIVTFWEHEWVHFRADLVPGNWNIGLNAINAGGWELPNGYTAFEIEISDGPPPYGPPDSPPYNYRGYFDIPASVSEIQHAFVNVDIATAGTYEYRFAWLNDSCCDGGDANIKIVSAFFDNTATRPVPEPATMFLLGTGLLGLAGFRRKFKK